MHDNMETLETPSVVFSMNKRNFIEDKYLVVDCLYDQTVSSPYEIFSCVDIILL